MLPRFVRRFLARRRAARVVAERLSSLPPERVMFVVARASRAESFSPFRAFVLRAAQQAAAAHERRAFIAAWA